MANIQGSFQYDVQLEETYTFDNLETEPGGAQNDTIQPILFNAAGEEITNSAPGFQGNNDTFFNVSDNGTILDGQSGPYFSYSICFLTTITTKSKFTTNF